MGHGRPIVHQFITVDLCTHCTSAQMCRFTKDLQSRVTGAQRTSLPRFDWWHCAATAAASAHVYKYPKSSRAFENVSQKADPFRSQSERRVGPWSKTELAFRFRPSRFL